MAGIREIRGRIKSVKSTQQITKTMKMVAAAKLRRAQSGGDGMRLFADRARDMVTCLSGYGADEPLLTPRQEVRTVCYVLFVGNRGLCGTYNHALVRFFKDLLAKEEHAVSAVVVGRWGRDVIEDEGIPVKARYADFGDVPRWEDAARLADDLKKLYLNGEADEISFVYQQYRSALQQTPVCVPFLPVRAEGEVAEPGAYLFEPSPEAVLHSAVELYVSAAVSATLREARMGEQAARMTAMTAATDATDELIDRLSLELNRARQAAITTEISEIVGGTNALKAGDVGD